MVHLYAVFGAVVYNSSIFAIVTCAFAHDVSKSHTFIVLNDMGLVARKPVFAF